MAEPGSYEERHERAREVFGRFVPGVEPDRVFGSMERRFGALGSFGFDAVGDLWSRPQLVAARPLAPRARRCCPRRRGTRSSSCTPRSASITA